MTITGALDAIVDASAMNPYRITVRPGVYNEAFISVKRFVHLAGSGRRDVIINGRVNLDTDSLIEGVHVNGAIASAAMPCAGVAIRDVEITVANSGAYGIYAQNCNIDVYDTEVNGTFAYGIYALGGSRSVISRVSVTGSGVGGIRAETSGGTRIENCNIDVSGAVGIHADAGTYNAVVRSCTVVLRAIDGQTVQADDGMTGAFGILYRGNTAMFSDVNVVVDLAGFTGTANGIHAEPPETPGTPAILKNSSIVGTNGGTSTSFGVVAVSPLDVVASRVTGFTYAGRGNWWLRCANSIFGNGMLYEDNGTIKFANCTDDNFTAIPNR